MAALMRRRRSQSVEGIMVAELEGEIEGIVEEENPRAGEFVKRRDAGGRPGEAGEHRVGEPRLDVNPFWSQRAVDEAHLQAIRPEDLPKFPGSRSRRGPRPSQRSELWTEVKTDLMADLEGASSFPGLLAETLLTA